MSLKGKKKPINMITASIVLYNENLNTLKKTVTSFLNTPLKKKLYLIDNSPNNKLESSFIHSEIEYLYVGENIGFGKAHNLILEDIDSNFHLILNPDVIFSVDVIPRLIKQLALQSDIAFITPKALYPDSRLQFICRKYPTVFDLINRRMKLFKNQIKNNEYRCLDLNKSFYPDFIHGCFMLFKTDCFKKLKGFDERYFLYMEDADLCKKVDEIGMRKMYFPGAEIIHQHQKGSSKDLKLFFRHTNSAIKYFLKWGFKK